MARSLSLAAYMALTRRAPSGHARDSRKQRRPTGELVWGHATTADKATALQQLGARLAVQRPGLSLLLTTPKDVPKPLCLGDNILWQHVPEEASADVLAFLAHWQPDICLWTGGNLRPALISSTADQDIPLFLIEAEVEGFDDARWRWLPDMSRAVLGEFTSVLAATANAAKRLRRLGVKPEKITVSGPLQQSGASPPYVHSDREELATTLAGRPIWLTAYAEMDELDIITTAHKSTLRLAHRLLLIIVPADGVQADEMYQRLTTEGWRVARWADGQSPEENTQILLADTTGEMGLWYRLSPISLIASSLKPASNGHSPYNAAALGSAILYGPNVGHHLSAYTRLAAVGAARIVNDGASLGAAVSRLIAPDQAASMAHAAWEVTSLGAEATDMVLDLVNDTLDLQGAG